METEDIAAWFSGLSFVVSVAAVIISSKAQNASDLAASGAIRSADSAERANDINLHNSRLAVYKAKVSLCSTAQNFRRAMYELF